ncbi:DNA topoisomerase type I [Aureococcus anophagefferens]|nr:DNA topoisomerase type I [Aureococcus anophagefferens]
MDIVMCVAEKPSIADAIAKALAKSTVSTRGGSPRTHEFRGRFGGASCEYRVTSVLGHCFNLDFAPAYRDWGGCDQRALGRARRARAEQRSVLRNLRETAKDCDALVLFLDCDREGEAIAFQVMDVTQSELRPATVHRAKFSAVTPADIEKAMATLGEPDERLSEAVIARQELDLRTPTLGFVVRREDEIATFEPEPYWFPDAALEVDGAAGRPGPGPVLRPERRRRALPRRGRRGVATVVESKAGTSTKAPPLPFNTVDLLKARAGLRLSPAMAMKHAEHLYLDGFLSYPRTETNKFPPSMDLRAAIDQQAGDARWGAHAADLLERSAWRRPKRGLDAGDHPPITPTAPAPPGVLNGKAAALYDLVTRRFLASVSEDAASRTSVAVDLAGERFVVERRALVAPGFLDVLRPHRDDDAGPPLFLELPALFDAVYAERPEDDASRSAFSRCGLTGHYLHLVPRPQRLYDPATKGVVDLPRGRRDDGGVGVGGDDGDGGAVGAGRARGARARSGRSRGPGASRRTRARRRSSARCPTTTLPSAFGSSAAKALFGGDARGAVLLEATHAPGRPPRLLSTRRPVFVAKFHASVAACRAVAGRAASSSS